MVILKKNKNKKKKKEIQRVGSFQMEHGVTWWGSHVNPIPVMWADKGTSGAQRKARASCFVREEKGNLPQMITMVGHRSHGVLGLSLGGIWEPASPFEAGRESKWLASWTSMEKPQCVKAKALRRAGEMKAA